MALRCVIVDDSVHFLEAASKLLEREGIDVVGVASTSAEALACVRELQPEVTLVDIDLNGESGFDVARELAATSDGTPTRTILISTRSEWDLAGLPAVTPVLGFISKSKLSGDAVRDVVADRDHGHGCRHEALLYSSGRELAEGTLQFVRQGLTRGDQLLVVLPEPGRTVLQQALGGVAAQIDFADAVSWYESPEHAFQQYTRYVDDRLERGAPRVRVVAEVIWPQSSTRADIAAWKRYEAKVSGAMASVPVSFICTYNTQELPPDIVTDAQRTHPVLRTAEGARPSAHYVHPEMFVRSLEHEVPELVASR
jgi:two-component system, NarL family, nitrate/nitrite response regulator NarL